MKINIEKITEILEQVNQPVTLYFILEKLGSEYKERSVRRWLVEMSRRGIIQIIGKKRATCYQLASKEYHSPAENISYVSEPTDLIRQPLFQRKPVSYNPIWLEEYKPNITNYLSYEAKDKMQKLGQRAKDEEAAGTYARQILNRLLIDLSYNSSRLEGNTYSLLDTQRLIIEGETAQGKLDAEKVMILNHKEAIRFLVDHADHIDPNYNTICTLHYLLSDGLVLPQYAGKIRDHGVRIGGSTYIPYENPKILEQKLQLICKKAVQIEDPFEQSFFLLTHISYLQAFTDVNKRTARLAANISFIKKNFVPLSFNGIEKEDYASAVICVYEFNDVRPLADLFITSYLRTCDLFNATAESLGFDRIRVVYRQQRRQLIREIIGNTLKGAAMQKYLEAQTIKLIPLENQAAFMEDLYEDLDNIGPQTIGGLGISVEQLNSWQNSHRGQRPSRHPEL